MKIKINENEYYSIEVPEEVDKTQFFGLQQRFERISKLMSRDIMSFEGSDLSAIPKVMKEHRSRDPRAKEERMKIKNREILIKLYKAYYSTDKQELFRVAKELGVDNYITSREMMSSGGMVSLKEEFNITSQEVGMMKFPKQGDSKRIDELRIKQ